MLKDTSMAQTQSGCDWFEDCDGVWTTACGNAHVIISDSPSDNGFKFCCYCGKALIEHAYDVEVSPL